MAVPRASRDKVRRGGGGLSGPLSVRGAWGDLETEVL